MCPSRDLVVQPAGPTFICCRHLRMNVGPAGWTRDLAHTSMYVFL